MPTPDEFDDTAVSVEAALPEAKLKRRLVIGDQVDSGGMALIRRAYDRNLRRVAALKQLRGELRRDRRVVATFIEEAQVTAQLDHPNIVPIYELASGPHDELFFTMKFVRGRTLASLMGERSAGGMAEGELFGHLQVFLKVCDAVSFAHSKGVIHRDIKPDNIMVGDFGEVYLVDWGVALLKHAGPSPVERAAIVGSPNYMAPELARGEVELTDERTDVFLLGATLFAILVGHPPFLGDSVEQIMARAVAGERTDPPDDGRIPPRLLSIALKAMSPERDRRHASAAALKSEIETFLHSGWRFGRKEFAAGQLILREGDVGDEAYIIVRGRCRVFKTIDGRRRVLRDLGPGDVFGETAILTNKPRMASVEAVEHSAVVVVTEEQFNQDLGMTQWIGLFVKALAERFRETDARATELQQQLARLAATR
ncbi:MAG: cyclic nucleotide-binding domain-containing protein [Deltaproteobacteria bacterium]|nr:cyclic nucleotide-binding domain-containing protein [Deltaproteobacteria bacterium]